MKERWPVVDWYLCVSKSCSFKEFLRSSSSATSLDRRQALKKLQGKRSPSAYAVSKRQEINRFALCQHKWFHFSFVALAPKAKRWFFPECWKAWGSKWLRKCAVKTPCACAWRHRKAASRLESPNTVSKCHKKLIWPNHSFFNAPWR